MMLHCEDNIVVFDHFRGDRLRSMIFHVHCECFRNLDGNIRRGRGYPHIKPRRNGTDFAEIPAFRDLPEIPFGERTPADIPGAHEENGSGRPGDRGIFDPLSQPTPVLCDQLGFDPPGRAVREHGRFMHILRRTSGRGPGTRWRIARWKIPVRSSSGPPMPSCSGIPGFRREICILPQTLLGLFRL